MAVIADAAVEVEAGIVTGVLQRLAEGHGAVGQGLLVPGVGAGAAAFLGLPVEDDGEVHALAAQMLDDELGLFNGLADVDSLRVEVDAGVEAGGVGAGDVPLVPWVQEQAALGVAAVAEADVGEVHALRDLLPVHFVLMLGDVDAELRAVGAALIDGLIVHENKIVGCQVAGGDVFIRRHPGHAGARVDIHLARLRILFLRQYETDDDNERNDQQRCHQ